MHPSAPSLVSLCIKSLKFQLLQGDDPIQDLYELPSELLHSVVSHLPALALHNFQTHMPFKCFDNYDDCFTNGRKRQRLLPQIPFLCNFSFLLFLSVKDIKMEYIFCRNDILGSSWKVLFKLRWPKLINHLEPPADWQQLYWEKHVQNCVDEAAEVAMRPTFTGRISSINVSDNILRYICHEEHSKFQKCGCTELSFHFHKFGSYLRCLGLLNVLCATETCELLRTSKLQTLVLHWIRSEKHIEPLCKLLIQSRESLTSLEFIHCKLSSSFISAICASLPEKDIHTNGIQLFCVKSSSIDIDPLAPPSAFITFLTSVRSLHSLHFSDSHLDRDTARMVFSTLLDSTSDLSSLNLSDNHISGWLSTFTSRSVIGSLSSGKYLQSLHKLNLRGNELDKYDAENLSHALLHMPVLETLDLSGNPIEDSGLRSLTSYMTKYPDSRLADLNLENCELSCCGVIKFLDALSTLEKPLKYLSIADNPLGSEVAEAIVNSLSLPIESLNISGIGLGPVGFLELARKLEKELKKLLSISISQNRGGLEAARFLSKLILLAPKLVSIDASYNFMPPESMLMLCESLRSAKGDLKRIDMIGNRCISHEDEQSSVLVGEFLQENGEPVFVLPSSSMAGSHVPYDDEP
ncbi:unnamed protein product [Cochlearia groenlandica]